jgi:signal transduction histidine kinase
VRLVNGGVELESSPGRGTRVKVYLPARKGGRGPS